MPQHARTTAARKAAPPKDAGGHRGARAGKAASAEDCQQLEQIPNIGPSVAADLRRLGIAHPAQLAGWDAYELYRALCRLTGSRHDPCVLDTFIAAVEFIQGAPARPWWAYTAERKRRYPGV